MLRRLAVSLLAAACGACSTAPMLLPARFDDGGIARRASAATAACPLRLASLTDTRADPSALGAMGSRPIRAADFASWARAGMDTRIAAGNGGAGPGLALEAQVLKAYAHGIGQSKSVDIVMRVRFLRDAQPLAEDLYRGSVTALNWSGGESEIHGAFAKALASVVDQVRADSAAHCAVPAPSI